MFENRLKMILKASIVAIIVNVSLGIFKAIVGMLSHSIAITMDAVNNFTDAASSMITIFSAKFAGKDADKKHPFGYGRTEYLGTLIIAGLILYAGLTAFMESFKLILHPQEPTYATILLVIIAVAVIVKIGLALYIVKVGKETNSDSLVASGKEAMADIAISIATLFAALLYIFANIKVEAWLGAVIAIVIINSGVETLKETIGKILGTPADPELVRNIKKAIIEHDGVEGAYDLILHNYGPDSYLASVHIAVKDTILANQFDEISRTLQDDILNEFNVYLSAIGMYCVNTHEDEKMAIYEKVHEIATRNEFVRQIHGFYVDDKKKMRFDLVVSLDAKDRRKVYELVMQEIKKEYPEYQISAGLDIDFNEV